MVFQKPYGYRWWRGIPSDDCSICRLCGLFYRRPSRARGRSHWRDVSHHGGRRILGGIIAGFLAGYVVKGLNATIKLPASLTSLKPILILPLFGTLIVGLAMIYVINPPVSQIMTTLSDWLKSMGEVNAMVLGAIIGTMMCIDMGGPVNKAAYTFSVGMLASQVHTPMATAMAAGMVPPIGMAIATWIARSKFTSNQRDAGKASFVLGLCFISEGALPFVAADPLRVIISSVTRWCNCGCDFNGIEYFSASTTWWFICDSVCL